MTKRSGFTLTEVMISLTMMLIVMGAVYRLMLSTQRLSRGQAERMSLQSNVRLGSLVVLSDLRGLNTVTGGIASQNDILAIAATDITYRAMRGIGFICEQPTTENQIRISRGTFSGYRDPQAVRDGLYVFIDGDEDRDADDVWLRLPITAVSTTTACPGATGPGITLTTMNLPSATTPSLVGLDTGTPVRFFEVMQVKLHQEDGRSWLGARSVSAAEEIQPVLGPLADGDGFLLNYSDAAGAVTTDPTAIKSIRVTLRGISEGAVNVGTGGSWTHVQEELVSQVALRNAFWQ